MTSIRFTGDWSVWLGVAAAVLVGAFTWRVYRRETRGREDFCRWLLPGLRTVAAVLLVLMLTGPVLSHRKVLGQLAKVLLFVDNSASMDLTDESMSPGRKLALAAELGMLNTDMLPKHVIGARRELAAAATAAGIDARQDHADIAVEIRDSLARALAHMEMMRLDKDAMAPAQKGTVTYQFWTNSKVSKLEDVDTIKGYPESPSGAAEVDRIQGRIDWSDTYLSRLEGYLYPPVTGEYTFWITADDMGWLLLSVDDSPANKKLIAHQTAWSPLENWEQHGSQKSKPVRLAAGRRYYFEVLHVEQSGGDHIAVGWRLPDGTLERPVGPERISPYRGGGPGAIYAESRKQMLNQFRDELLNPAERLAKNPPTDVRESTSKRARLAAACKPWRQILDRAFEQWAEDLVQSGVDDIRRAVERVDAMTRSDRMDALLLGGEEPVLQQLAGQHSLDVIAFGFEEIEPLWHSRMGNMDVETAFPDMLGSPTSSEGTNVSLGLMTAIGLSQEVTPENNSNGDRVAAVILSDGRHNVGPSPLQKAKICGSASIPVYTVAFGALKGGPDAAVIAVDTPESVFFKDRVNGRIAIKDDMPADRQFKLQIQSRGKVVWETELTSTGAGRRLIDFDFAVEDLVEKELAVKDRRLQFQSSPLEFEASVSGLDNIDVEPSNDRSSFRCQAVLRRNRVLILDGRPRWEYRYIRNLFERDDKWEVSAVSADPTTGGPGIKRGDVPGRFAATREYLLTHDLFVIGDLPAEVLREQEMKWIREAVRRNGCGVIFIDGLRGNLRGYEQTPLAELLPVAWAAEQAIRNPISLRLTEQGVLHLTERGADVAALTLSSGVKTNSEIWASLKPPHWLAAVEPLAGSEILVEAQLKDRKVPALVYRRFGAGKVLYAAMDETWRWRYRVADEYHQRYWNQVGRLIMAQPFAVRDRFVSIDCGALVYSPGQNAAIRTKIYDTEGRPVTNAQAVAHLYRNGSKIASVQLELDKNNDTYRGTTGALKKGSYEVRVEVAGYPPEQMIAAGQFFVDPVRTSEMAELNCNEQLLRQIAQTSGGRFVREHELSTLVDQLQPLSSGRIIETETVLWQSYWWFTIIVALLTIEWILRKRAGML